MDTAERLRELSSSLLSKTDRSPYVMWRHVRPSVRPWASVSDSTVEVSWNWVKMFLFKNCRTSASLVTVTLCLQWAYRNLFGDSHTVLTVGVQKCLVTVTLCLQWAYRSLFGDSHTVLTVGVQKFVSYFLHFLIDFDEIWYNRSPDDAVAQLWVWGVL